MRPIAEIRADLNHYLYLISDHEEDIRNYEQIVASLREELEQDHPVEKQGRDW